MFAMIAGMIIVLLPGMYMRFDSLRTRETLLEARRVEEGALIVWGTARHDRYDIGLDGGNLCISGTLWDRIGPAVSFGERRVTLPCQSVDGRRRPA